jgi:proteasome beta subunit
MKSQKEDGRFIGVELVERDQKKFTGTTTVGVVCKDGVVLAADTRATAGYLIASKRARKLYEITDRVAVTMAGGVGDVQALVRMLRAEAQLYTVREGRPIPVSAVAKMASNLLHSQLLLPYLAHLLVGGVDELGPRLYFAGMEGTLTEERMVATGSGSPVAYGVLENGYREGMRVKEILPVAVRAVRTAMKRDVATGNEVEVLVIREEGIQRLTPEEILKLS